MVERVLITGITGQDGSYLAEQLLLEGCEVAGLRRSSSTGNLGNVEHLKKDITFFRGDLDDETSIEVAVSEFKPHQIYNLGAEAAPADSFKRRVYTSDVNALGPLRVFEAALRLQREVDYQVKVYQASSSEMYGEPLAVPQNEETPFMPNNPYGAAKLLAHHNARQIRQSPDRLFVSCGILFNHESPRRGMQYVTRKVSAGVACIVNKVKNLPLNEADRPILNEDRKLEMGNLAARRDWGYSKEYVSAMRLMLAQEHPDDFIIATGEGHSIEDLLEAAFGCVSLDWRDHVAINPEFVRPLETGPLCGDSSKAMRVLGWKPTVKFEALIRMMVEADLQRFPGQTL